MEANRINHITIQQYLDGKLDEKAMHELEKQALEDPFLADALEGYEHAEMPVGHQLSLLQAQLQTRIAQQQEEKNVFNFNWQRLSVAAAACLLFVTASMLFWLRENKAEQQLALRPKQVDVNLTSLDSIKKPSQKIAATGLSKVPEVEVSSSSIEPIKRNTSDRLLAVANAKREKNEVSNIISSAVTDSTKAKSDNTAAATFAVNAKDLQEMASLTANQSMQGRVAGNEDNLKKSSPSERIVSGYGTQKSAKNFVAGRAPGSPQPVIGWDLYPQYLKENIRYTDSMKVEGIVILSFIVSKEGKPLNIKVDKGLNKHTDLEAIRLLKDGPLWQRRQDSVAKVVVLFEK